MELIHSKCNEFLEYCNDSSIGSKVYIIQNFYIINIERHKDMASNKNTWQLPVMSQWFMLFFTDNYKVSQQ